MAKTNKLTSSAILQGYSKEFVQKKVVISINGKDYEVLVDQKFRVSKINKLIVESLDNFKNLKDVDESVKIGYFMFLIIKHFSDIDIVKADKFEDQIRVSNAMLDLEIFEKIINAFPENELKKINEYMLKFAERMDDFVKDNKSVEELKEIINKEINGEFKEDNVNVGEEFGIIGTTITGNTEEVETEN